MVKTIYDPQCRRLIGKPKQIRQGKRLRQIDAARQLQRSRKWLGKIETCDLRLDVSDGYSKSCPDRASRIGALFISGRNARERATGF